MVLRELVDLIMDFDIDRIIYLTLFYDFHIQDVVNHLISGQVVDDGEWFYDKLKHILHEHDPSLNMQEAEAYVRLYREDRVNKLRPVQITTPIAGVFKQLRYCSERFLDNKDDILSVNEDHFLEWNELTQKTGEDLLVCAWKGMSAQDDLPTYAWPDVLNCGGDVTDILKQKPLCDIHAHLGGAADPFILNWLCLMNGGFMDDSQFDRGEDKEYGLLRKWSVLAARIRIEMYKKFLLEQKDTFGMDFQTCLKEIEGEKTFFDGRNRVKTLVELHKNEGRQTIDREYVDYAIRADCQDENMDSPYMLWHGERRLICVFLSSYLTGSNEIRRIAPYVYLYCLIKCHFRKEIMMTRRHRGLSYFNEYNSKKYAFIRSGLKGLASKYAFQTSIRPNSSDGVELRINAVAKELGQAKDWSLNNCLFVQKEWIEEPQKQNVTYLIHLSKSQYGKGTYVNSELMSVQQLLEKELRQNHVFTGVDAAGGEVNCRPENLGYPYRYLFERGHRNFTYHVGEDFYDISDGLRSIDEALVFLNAGRGWRLGHCVAMGIDVADFYKKKKQTVVLPRQILLDNLVWILHRCEEWNIHIQKQLKQLMVDKIQELYEQCGYESSFSSKSYFNSMWLRSDVKGVLLDGLVNTIAWERAKVCHHHRCEIARSDSYAARMAHDYRIKRDLHKNEDSSSIWKVNKEYENVICRLQEHLMSMVKQMKIGIESCPTSNRMLCNIDRYEKVPLLRFSQMIPWKGGGLPVTINTDDKGLFSTTLLNEFSLIASALSKQKGWLQNTDLRKWVIIRFLSHISERGFKLRFNWDNNEYGAQQY